MSIFRDSVVDDAGGTRCETGWVWLLLYNRRLWHSQHAHPQVGLARKASIRSFVNYCSVGDPVSIVDDMQSISCSSTISQSGDIADGHPQPYKDPQRNEPEGSRCPLQSSSLVYKLDSKMLLIPAILAATIGALIYFALIERYFKDANGLRRFDGPLLARLTNWWVAYVTCRNARSSYVLDAHRRYGPVVRIQPDHLSFSEPRAIVDIYSFQSKMLKSEFYESFSGPDHAGKNERSIINTRDRDAHTHKRKLLASAFAHKNIVQMEPVLRDVMIRLTGALDGFCERPPVCEGAPEPGLMNLYKWVNLFTYDAIGELGFGRSFGFIESGDDVAVCEETDGKQYKAHIIDAFQTSSLYDTLMASWPNVVHPLKRYARIDRLE